MTGATAIATFCEPATLTTMSEALISSSALTDISFALIVESAIFAVLVSSTVL